MTLNITSLNGDTTFLLTFSPSGQRPLTPESINSSRDFTVLVDPWLSGPSQVWHPKFATTLHTVPACINRLSEIPEPDLILISQDKPDHCHEATLRQLDPASSVTTILAEPGAAKKIKGWKHFKPSQVHAIPTFSEKKSESIVRIEIPGTTPDTVPGEATIAFMSAKRDLTGLHTAIGITYRPPSSTAIYNPSGSIDSKSIDSSSSLYSRGSIPSYLPLTPPDSPPSSTSAFSRQRSTSLSTCTNSTIPSRSRISNISNFSRPFTANTSSRFQPSAQNSKTLSVIYSPHGVTYSQIRAYASTHLILSAALPLTALLHPFDRVQQPWWLGGNISAGLPGGLEIAQNLLARCWISAHDEDKENSGVSVKTLVTRKHTVEEVKAQVEEGGRAGKVATDVRVLDAGETLVLRA